MIDEFVKNCNLSDTQLKTLLESTEFDSKLRENADIIRKQHYGTDVYIRGLIEFTNFCKNDCYYCGIRKDNKNAHRYRLSKEDIMECCKDGYSLGFRTFVLQGGEDPYFTDEKICDIVYSIKEKYSDCAVTLSIGEKSKESYKAYFDAGADRYLLRHETADETHYSKLHPHSMSLKNRKQPWLPWYFWCFLWCWHLSAIRLPLTASMNMITLPLCSRLRPPIFSAPMSSAGICFPG